MSVADPDLKDLERRMNGAIEVLKQEFAGLRTGRASVHLLEPINVDAYGSSMPMNQVGTIGVPEPRMITVQVWDRSLAGAVERAIRESDLGLNPQTDGQLIRVPIPMLSEERRVELSKIAHKYAEQARVAVRNVRRDGMDMLKRMEREHELSQDEQHMWSEEIQEMTDRHIKVIDETLEQKDGEIMQV
jgi:ribosome recycling factor